MRHLPLALVLALALVPASARAYPWMIRHGYTACASCHDDPSGGSLLTQYGRAQAELLLATRYGGKPAATAEGEEGAEEEEASPQSLFAFGAVPLPDWLNLALAFRGGGMAVSSAGTTSTFPLQMVTDVRAGLNLGMFRAGAALGYAARRALPASLTRNDSNNITSREHWAGLSFADDTLLVRAGRMNLPYGIRNVEHYFFVRDDTNTDINEDQQHGVALSYSGETWRGELMAIAGNFQLRPDAYRERGYSGFAEWAVAERLAVGFSSLLTHARYDAITLQPGLWRMSNGLFARWSPWQPLVLMAEADVISRTTQQSPSGNFATASLVQADLELLQGVHLLGAGELRTEGGAASTGGWLGAEWFFNSHASVRADGIVRRTAGGDAVYTLLGQLHVNL